MARKTIVVKVELRDNCPTLWFADWEPGAVSFNRGDAFAIPLSFPDSDIANALREYARKIVKDYVMDEQEILTHLVDTVKGEKNDAERKAKK